MMGQPSLKKYDKKKDCTVGVEAIQKLLPHYFDFPLHISPYTHLHLFGPFY